MIFMSVLLWDTRLHMFLNTSGGVVRCACHQASCSKFPRRCTPEVSRSAPGSGRERAPTEGERQTRARQMAGSWVVHARSGSLAPTASQLIAETRGPEGVVENKHS